MRDARAEEKREKKKKGKTRTGLSVSLRPRLKFSLSTYRDGPSAFLFLSPPRNRGLSPIRPGSFQGPWLPLESPKEHGAVVRSLPRKNTLVCTLSIPRALSPDTLPSLSALASRPSPSVVEHGAREVVSKEEEGAETQRSGVH